MALEEISIVFSAVTAPFQKGLADVTGGLEGLQRHADLNQAGIGEAIKGVGKGLTKGVTLPLAAAGAGAGKMYMDFEDAMLGVRKTTDLTDSEFQNMSQQIRDMSKEVPASAREIAGVAEAAGQLGIEKENIMGFSRTMTDLGVATNMSSDEAATSLARLANITGMPQSEFDRLGSTVVDLGNNYATTEKEIVDMGLRLAGTSSMVGLTEAETLGLATAMSSVGINAEAGGSSMSRVMQKINSSVSQGGESLDRFAKASGMSAEEFATQWRTNPQDALSAFIEGIGDVDASGGDVIAMLEELGITGSREVDTLQRLAGAGDMVSEAMATGTNAWEENVALSEEAEMKYGSLKSQLEIVKNKLIDAAVAIGERVAPMLVELADKVGAVAEWFTNLSPEVQDFILKAVGVAMAVGPILMVVGSLVGKLKALKTIGSIVMGGLKLLPRLFSPVGLAIMAIIGIGVLLYKNWDTIKEKASQLASWVSEKWEALKTATAEKWDAVKTAVTDAIDTAKETVSRVVETIKTAVTDKWNAVKTKTQEIWDAVKTKVSDTIQGAMQAVKDKANAIKSAISDKWNAVKSKTQEIWDNVKSKVSDTIQGAMQAVKDKADSIKSTISDKWSNVKSKTQETWDNLKDKVSTSISNAASDVATHASDMLSNVQTAFGEILSVAKEKMENVKTAVSEGFSRTVEAARGFIQSAWNVGADLIGGFVSGVKAKAERLVSAVTGAVSNAIGKAKSLLGIASPSKVFDKFGRFSMMGFERGIDRTSGLPVRAVSGMVRDVESVMNRGGSFGLDVGGYGLNQGPDLAGNKGGFGGMVLNLRLGARSFRAFVDDISDVQNREYELMEVYDY